MRHAIPFCALATIALVAGCRLFDEPADGGGHSLLRPASPSPDSVAMVIIWARFAVGDPELNREAWQEIDETQIPLAVRRELAANGFRAGVVGPTVPDAIARALRLSDEPPAAQPADGQSDQQNETQVDPSAEPTVRRRLLQLRRGRRAEIQASDVCDTLPLLISEGRELGGRTFYNAQAIYALQVDPQPDQTVRVELTPELHHGQPHIRWTSSDDGILRQAPLREREVFERMRLDVKLAPGEMLLLMSLPDAGSRLGECFHTVDAAEGREQKLVLVRLAEVPPGDAFDAPAAF
jgi:hypothetical protein